MAESTSKSAVITGGSSGIGLAIAHKMSDRGYKVLVADKDPLEDTKNKILFSTCDVTDPVQVGSLFTKVQQEIGVPDVLILSAGRGIKEKLTEGDPAKWQQVMDVNVMGVLRCIRAFVPGMLSRKNGSVVLISSVAVHNPHLYGGVYSASKTAAEVIAETLRLETLPYINVHIISPGITDTRFFTKLTDHADPIAEMGMGAIAAEELAEDVMYCLQGNRGSGINKIIRRPNGQDF